MPSTKLNAANFALGSKSLDAPETCHPNKYAPDQVLACTRYNPAQPSVLGSTGQYAEQLDRTKSPMCIWLKYRANFWPVQTPCRGPLEIKLELFQVSNLYNIMAYIIFI